MKRKLMPFFLIIVLTIYSVAAFGTRGYAGSPSTASPGHDNSLHFVPNSLEFWDFSKNWTTYYGPAYRDTVLERSQFLPCTGKFALCFHSGPEPLPCKVTDDGRFADCTCVVKTGLNFVLMTAILNYQVYLNTVAECGLDGSKCADTVDKAPVCRAIKQGKLIPGAEVISTYSPSIKSDIIKVHEDAADKPKLTICPEHQNVPVRYAGCMTASCKTTSPGRAECSCPVFWGIFQLVQPDAACHLGDSLVWSASYDPARDMP